MFEHYSPTTTRIIFSARYDAIASGSRSIDTDNLLSGLLREDPQLIMRCLSGAGKEVVRLKVDGYSIEAIKEDATLTDLPFSSNSKQVLMHAADEAKSRGVRSIGSEHLLLGLLMQESGIAAMALDELGVSIAEVRKYLEEPPQHPEMT